MLNKFADELREQREKSGISLQQLATKTRIDLKFLEAIDQGNFAFLPDLYVKAFVKQYAKTVGLDENLAIKKFEAAREGKEYDPNQPSIEVQKEEPVKKEISLKPIVNPIPPVKSYVENPLEKKPEEPKKSNKQNLILIVGGAVVVIIILLIMLFSSKSNEIVVEETPIEDSIKQNQPRYEEQPVEKVSADSSVVPASSDSLYLTFNAKETSWVYIILDNVRTQEFTLSPNSEFTIAALNSFKATVGNSGGVSLQMNNQPVDFTGRSGSVRHFRLDRTGLIYLNAPPKLEQQ